MSDERVHFRVFWQKRAWRPLAGFIPPEGDVFVMRSDPGMHVAQGRSFDAASENLRMTIAANDRSMKGRHPSVIEFDFIEVGDEDSQ